MDKATRSLFCISGIYLQKIVKNIKKAGREVLGLRVTMDLGANVTLTGGVALQTQESWCEFISKDLQSISFGGNAAELYFEEDKFDDFLKKLAAIKEIFYVHPVQQYSWGQRVIRFYDPDFHILEVGENMKSVCRRFLDSDMTIEAAAIRMNVSEKFVRACVR